MQENKRLFKSLSRNISQKRKSLLLQQYHYPYALTTKLFNKRIQSWLQITLQTTCVNLLQHQLCYRLSLREKTRPCIQKLMLLYSSIDCMTVTVIYQLLLRIYPFDSKDSIKCWSTGNALILWFFKLGKLASNQKV